MSIITSPLLLGADGVTQYQVSRSLRFNSADSAYLSKNFASAGNRKTFTFSCWAKIGQLGSQRDLFSAAESGTSNPRTDWRFDSSNNLTIEFNPTGGAWITLTSAAVFRDASAWYHVVVAVDTTQATSSDRTKVYVNGVQQTMTGSYVSQNTDLPINNSWAHSIGRYQAGTTSYLDGYLAEVHFIDGQALTPSSFTETDATTGQLVPKAYGGSYGTNGFKLNFSDNSTVAALGTDTSGNGNTWTVNNISVTQPFIYSQNYTSTYTGGNTYSGDGWRRGFDANLDNFVSVYYASETTLTLPAGVTWSSKIRVRIFGYSPSVIKINGTTLSISYTTSPAWYDVTSQLGSSGTLGTIYINSVDPGANYLAFCAVELDNVVLYDNFAGFVNGGTDSLVDTPTSYGTGNNGGDVRGNYMTFNPLTGNRTYAILSNGNLQLNSTGTYAAEGNIATPSSGKWYWEGMYTDGGSGAPTNAGIGFKLISASPTDYPGYVSGSYAYNSSGLKRNNASTSSYGAAYVQGDVIGLALDLDAGTATFYKNGVSQGVAFSGLSGNYTTHMGSTDVACYFYLNAGQRPFVYPVSGFKALCDTNLPTPVIAKPNTVMDTVLYTGNDAARSITGLAFNPDLVWIKSRSATTDHKLTDSVRGVTKALSSNLTTAEATDTEGLTAFNSNGFSLGTDTKYNSSLPITAGLAWTNSGMTEPIWSNYPNLTTLNVTNYSTVTLSNASGQGTNTAITYWYASSPAGPWTRNNSHLISQLPVTINGNVSGNYLRITLYDQSNVTTGSLTVSNASAGGPYVAWAWDAGTSTVTNTAGSITSQVRANASAGFSVVTYTGVGSTGTIGHGLGVAPSFYIVKARTNTAANSWRVYHSALGNTKQLLLESTSAEFASSSAWNNTSPTSTVFSVGSFANESSGNYVAYCFAPVAGYSNGFSYTGNGSADGVFQFLGFRPRLIMLKRSDSTSNWILFDTSREGYNVDNNHLYPNISDAEGATDLLDITSNGFKLRSTDTIVNASAGTYIGFAWAENPFQYARAR